jgi:hypothetical protein
VSQGAEGATVGDEPRGRATIRLLVGLLSVGLLVAVVLLLWPDAFPATEPGDVEAVGGPLTFPLTGMPTEALPVRPAMLVKVSNSPEARPQTGLEAADVVFEELTEGGVTRFLAVFHSQPPAVVGPVRSARPVDTALLSGFGYPGFAYSGARPEVRAMLVRAPAALLTEGAPGFFRDDGRYASHPVAPHDLFVELGPATDAAEGAGAQPLGDIGWIFDEARPPDTGSDATAIDIRMSDTSTTSWTFDAGESLYRREQNGAPTVVTGTESIGAANVIVLDVRHYVGASGYPETDVVGEGPALVLRDGQRYAAWWAKPTATATLEVLAPDGETPFPLRPGPTWIHLPDALPR